MKQRVTAIAVGVACFALGATIQRLYDTRRPQQAQIPRPTPQPAAPAAQPPAAAAADFSKIDFSKEPLWAYGRTEPPKPGETAAPQAPPTRNLRPGADPAEQTEMRHVEESKTEYSLVDIRDGSSVIDWFPEDHPPMPDIIEHGPAAAGEQKRGCGSCHLPNGKGRPENASPAGLPAAYILRQLNDFRNGLRHSADPRKANTNTMILLAKAMTDEEMRQAAEYFSAVKWTPRFRVVETNLVPTTRIAGELYIATSNKRTEPIAGRIIEVPEDEEQTEALRNPRVGFVAYVPVGSIRKGKDLVTLGGMKVVNGQIVQGKTTACGACHGTDLMGVAPDVPPIAGRSPSYLARQIFDTQQGARNGSNSSVQLMKMVVDKLTPEDIVAITAYLASRPVPAVPADQLVARR